MRMHLTRKKTALIVGAAVLVTVGGAGVAIAGADDDAGERAITGRALDRASEAALAETGAGTVTATEVDDEESKYEVEVTLENGQQVDVQLDESFDVVGTEGEDGSEDEDS